MADTNKLDREKPRKKKKGKMERVVGWLGEARRERLDLEVLTLAEDNIHQFLPKKSSGKGKFFIL